MIDRYQVGSILLCLTVFFTGFDLSAAEPDWTLYNSILKKYVSKGTRNNINLNLVQYSHLKNDPAWQRLISQMSNFPQNKLQNRSQKLAFYINVYNIFTIDLIINHGVPTSIKKISNQVWQLKQVTLENKKYSLDHVEHAVIRPLNEPRIHFALVCAALSCPDLRNEAYQSSKLNYQLKQQSVAFLSNPTKGLRKQGNVLHVSKIFEWFRSDFDSAGGVLTFLQSHSKSADKNSIVQTDLKYDWSLNGY